MFNKKLRKAVAMIELIFAIVIMGIVMMSAPMLLTQASNSSITLVQQEAITAASTQMGLILTHHWDEQDTNDSLQSPILSTASPVAALREATDADGNLTGRRRGTSSLSSRSYLTALSTRLAASAISNDGDATPDDVDDYNGVISNLIPPPAAISDDYKDNSMQLVTTVVYTSDSPSGITTYNSQTLTFNNPTTTPAVGGTSNIKSVSVQVTSTGTNDNTLHTNVILNAFSCNIGTYVLGRRTF